MNTISDLPSVLLVEHDQSLKRVLSIVLERANFMVICVSNDIEALDILEKQPPDAVILDLGYPRSHGGKVLEYLRHLEDRKEPCPAWLVISTLDRDEIISQFRFLESPFLAKPFNPSRLVSTLRELLTTRLQTEHHVGEEGINDSPQSQ